MSTPVEKLENQSDNEHLYAEQEVDAASELEKRDSDVTVILEVEPEQPGKEVLSEAETVVITSEDDEEIQLEKRTLIEEQQLIIIQKEELEAEKQEIEQQQRIQDKESRTSRLLRPVKKKKRKKYEGSSDRDVIESHKSKKPKIQEDEENELDKGYASPRMVFSQQAYQACAGGSQAGASVQNQNVKLKNVKLKRE